ncbi:Annexin [Penicillium digitatum]|uniref:Annexin n=1 Tax=Penicillium digitatum TaxID=36651 RepID=A0A7T7BQD3_PENDI|nr:Annexin [Penicillium digitatum]
MSLQVNDPRSRTRSKSPGRERSRPRSRDSRVPSPSPSPSHRSRPTAVEIPPTKSYNSDEEAEIERQYKLISERRRETTDEPRPVISRARTPRYDVDRSGSDSESKRRETESSRRHRDDRYEHSDGERSSATASSRSHRRRSSPDRGSRVNHDSDDLAYGDAPGVNPSYARPNRYSYSQPTQFVSAAPRQPGFPAGSVDWASIPECERPGHVPPSSQAADPATMPGAFPVASTYSASSAAMPASVIPSLQHAELPGPQATYAATSAGYVPSHYRTASASDPGYPPPAAGYANPGVYQYAQFDPSLNSTDRFRSNHRGSISRSRSSSSSSHLQTSIGTSTSLRDKSLASPLLEPYHGTYQSISPMPTTIVIPSVHDDDVSDLEPLDGRNTTSDSSRRSKHLRSHSSVGEKESRSHSKDKKDKERDDNRRTRPSTSHDRHDSSSSALSTEPRVLVSPTTGRKRVSFYDAGPDAAAMQSALNHTRNIDSKPIIQILPRLTSDEILLLRQEYKARVRIQGKGINLAKHLRLKLGSSSFGKVCYATALGRWESEAYWANCYYQAGTSRRELLIESLMGRSNAAIREIKNSFRDTRYDNSLERCMRSELRADKFRIAILLALEGQRQDEREPLDKRLVSDDVHDLHRAIVREGGETAMIHIIVLRSDTHLREVLRAYEDNHGHNFARAMISKSRNLVGETLAHILNGAINRPMRDALLLHQALRESRPGRERSELLISRLVRLHWEPRHLDLVKNEYRRRYHERLEEAIAEEILSLNGGEDWGEFCIELARNA